MYLDFRALVCSGKGGVCNNGRQVGSIYWVIYVSGLTRFDSYFASLQLMNESHKSIATQVWAWIVSIGSRLGLLAAIPVMPSQCPPGEIFLVEYRT